MKKQSLSQLLLICILAFQSASCTKSSKPISEVSPTELQGLLRNDFALLIDTREAHEVQNGIAQPAQWLALSHIQTKDAVYQQFIQSTPKSKQVVLYCSTSACAREAAQVLSSDGFKVGILGTGEFEVWSKAGLPTKK
jgi:rhodanese-related sulfurtransferase